MKTAISLPDSLFSEADKIAQDLGIPRSQLFAKALEDFIKNYKKEDITKNLNKVYGKIDVSNNEIDSVALEALRKLTANDSW